MSPEDEEQSSTLVRAAVTELYAGPPAEFVSRRTELVRAAKAARQKDAATQIGALRKPSVAAWALNQVVRSRPEVLERLTDVGTRMRHAQSALDASGLAALRGERDEVLAGLVAAAGEVAVASEQSLTPAVEAEVRDTGIAALADSAATEVVASGALTRALHYSGFGEVDVSDAVARTSTGVVLTRIQGGGEDAAAEAAPEPGAERVATQDGAEVADGPGDEEPDRGDGAAEELRARLASAEAALAAADRQVSIGASRLEQARSRTEATRQRIEKLRADLEAAQADDEAALEEMTLAVQQRKEAEAARAQAQQEVDRLTADLDQVT